MGDIVSEIAKETAEKAPEATGAVMGDSGESQENEVFPPGETEEEKARRLHRSLPSGSTRKPGEKRGRRSQAEIDFEAKAQAEMTLQAEIQAREKVFMDYKVTGRQIADGFIYSNVVFLGPEFNFMEFKDASGNVIKNEREEFYKVGADMAEQYDWKKLPPWVQIAFIMASYYGIRAAMPPVRERIGKKVGGFFGWLKKKFWKKPMEAAQNQTALPPGDKTGA